jgi:hypothetical protein
MIWVVKWSSGVMKQDYDDAMLERNEWLLSFVIQTRLEITPSQHLLPALAYHPGGALQISARARGNDKDT